MATFPSKVNFVTGDVLTATNMNDIGGAINLLDGAQYAAGKNKFINANMAIAQRGAAAQTVSAAGRTFGVDRTFGTLVGTGVFTVEQVVDSPAAANAGQYSMKAVVTTADAAIAAADQYYLGQIIEGFNFASFQFGTASAQTVTISFWVKSSLTGTFGVAIRNSGANRSYVTTYTISAANTWEKKTLTIAGDTSGTWLQDSGIGARIEWILSVGSDNQTATPNVWTATNDQTTSAQTNWMATLANSFNITAIQIEAAQTASPFQLASGSIGSELALCQRYFMRYNPTSINDYAFAVGIFKTTTSASHIIHLPVTLRITPGVTFPAAANFYAYGGAGAASPSAISAGALSTNTAEIVATRALTVLGSTSYLQALGTAAATIDLSAEL